MELALVKAMLSVPQESEVQLPWSKLARMIGKVKHEKHSEQFDVSVPLDGNIWRKCAQRQDLAILSFQTEDSLRVLNSRLPNQFQVKDMKITTPRAFLTLERGDFLNHFAHSPRIPAEPPTNSSGGVKIVNQELLRREGATNLSAIRCTLAGSVAANLGQFLVSDPPLCFRVGSSDLQHLTTQEGEYAIQVGSVVDPKSKKKIVDKSLSDMYTTLFKIHAEILSERTNSDMSRIQFVANVHSLTSGNLTFQLLSSNLATPCILKPAACKEASFVMYNYTRIVHILKGFQMGEYPPSQTEVDLSVLVENDEWTLVYDHLSEYPNLFRSLVDDLEDGKLAPSRLVQFLVAMTNAFSRFYNRWPVLKDPKPHLLPVIFARVHVVERVKAVLDHALGLLNVQPILNM